MYNSYTWFTFGCETSIFYNEDSDRPLFTYNNENNITDCKLNSLYWVNIIKIGVSSIRV
jgi:hypothetical protein